MIGLKRHAVRLMDYGPEWAPFADAACKETRLAGDELLADVQHVGSTAVPGLSAKPIIDIAAAVRDLALVPELIERLTRIGYLDRGDRGGDGGHLFIMESSPDVRTIHLHVVEHNGDQWNNYLRFRDLLRDDSTIRDQYSQLKRDLALKFPGDRLAYTAAKEEFIERTLKR